MNTISFRGVICSGVGRHVELHVPGKDEIRQAPTDWPTTLKEGSLNVCIASDGYPGLFAALNLPNSVRSLDRRPFPAAFEIAQHEFGNNQLGPKLGMPERGSAQVWRAILTARGHDLRCWVLRRYGSGVGEQLELLSQDHMRTTYQLEDRQPVVVTLGRGDD
jgi:hypothetical protein